MDKGNLMYRVISGTASESEKAELNEWLASEPGNRADFEDIKFVLEGVNQDRKRDNQFHSGLRKIKRRIRILKGKNRKSMPYIIRRIVGAIFIIVSITVLLFTWFVPGIDKNLYSQMIIICYPDSYGADSLLGDNLIFDNVTVEEVIKVLENEHDLVFEIQSPEILSCHFTGAFSKGTSRAHIIRTLAQSIGLNYSRINDRKYIVKGRGCRVGYTE